MAPPKMAEFSILEGESGPGVRFCLKLDRRRCASFDTAVTSCEWISWRGDKYWLEIGIEELNICGSVHHA